MALVVCKRCKLAFINSPRNEDVCPACEARLREIYPTVRNFLRNNETRLFSVLEVSNLLNIELKDINGLISMGLIDSSDSYSEDKQQKELKAGPCNPRVTTNPGMHVYHKKKAKGTQGKE